MIQCPGCGGALKFDIRSQLMMCDSCSTTYDPKNFSSGGTAEEETEYNVTIFRCPNCGGEIASTDETAAAFCSYCGSSTILESRISKEKKPQLIIPFKKTKQDCTNAFERFIKKAIFAPGSYRQAGKAESFRGIYMPYWLYDMSQRGDINIATSTSHRSGDYIITDHYMMKGTLDNYYNGVSYDASSSFADDISSAIAPFSVKDIVPFNQSYLSGFYADIADVGVGTYKDIATDLAQESTYNYLRKKSPMAGYPFDTPKERVKSSIRTNINVTRSAMFPVWFMSYRNRDRVAYATVNGQSGKVSADVPMSVPKYFVCAIGIAAVLFAIFQMIFTITPNLLALIVSIFGLVSVLSYGSEMKKIVAKENYDDDLGMQAKEALIEEKKRQRVQAQAGAVFDDTGVGNGGAYVLTKNDIKRAKKDKAKHKKADQKSGNFLGIIVFIVFAFIMGGSFLASVLESVFDNASISAASGFLALIFLIISIVSVVNATKNISRMKSKNGLPASIFTTISLLIIMIIGFWNPPNDSIYYGAVVIAGIGIIINILGIIRNYNLLAMRPLPQFEMYQGGDDRG